MPPATLPLRSALQSLVRRPALSLTILLVNGLGLAALLTTFSLVEAFLLRPLPYADADRLVWLQSRSDDSLLGVSHPDYLDWQKQLESLSGIAMFDARHHAVLSFGDHAESVRATRTTANLFPLLGVPPEHGRWLSGDSDRPGSELVVVLSHGLWEERYGGDREVIGRRIDLDGAPYTVVGVMPQGFRFPSRTDLWVPSSGWADQWPHRNIRVSAAIGRLAPGADLSSLRSEADVVGARLQELHPATNAEIAIEASSLREVTVGSSRRGLLLLLTACFFLLLIAAANTTNLLLIHLSTQTTELAMRSALGATRAELLRQQALASGLLAVGTATFAALLAAATLPVVRALLPGELPDWVSVRLDWSVLLVGLGISVLVTVGIQTLPLALLLRRDIARRLTGRSRSASADHRSLRSRRLLAAVQLGLALLLTSGAWLLLASYSSLRDTDPGFETERVLTAEIDLPEFGIESYQQVTVLYQEIAARLGELPVEAAALSTSLPLTGQEVWEQWEVTIEGETEAEARANPRIHGQGVTGSYFQVLRIPRLSGRFFEAGDAEAEIGVIVISRRLAETFWPGQNAVGKRLHLGGPDIPAPWLTVVGVAGDVLNESLSAEGGRDLYMPLGRLPSWPIHLIVRERPEVVVEAATLRQRIWEVSPDLGIRSMVPFDQKVSQSLWHFRALAALAGVLAVLGLTLGLLGTFVVLAHLIEERKRELSIRVALGTNRPQVALIVLGEVLRLLMLGGFAGLTAAILLNRFLESQLFGVRPLEAGAFASATVAVVLIALLASVQPLRRAVRLDFNRHLQEL